MADSAVTVECAEDAYCDRSWKKLTATEVCLLATKLSKEDVRKYSRFDTLTTTLCDQQDALDEAQRRYDEQVESASARIT